MKQTVNTILNCPKLSTPAHPSNVAQFVYNPICITVSLKISILLYFVNTYWEVSESLSTLRLNQGYHFASDPNTLPLTIKAKRTRLIRSSICSIRCQGLSVGCRHLTYTNIFFQFKEKEAELEMMRKGRKDQRDFFKKMESGQLEEKQTGPKEKRLVRNIKDVRQFLE